MRHSKVEEIASATPEATQSVDDRPFEDITALNDQTTPDSMPTLKEMEPQKGGVALAMGGGAARGWAHIGALKAIDEIGIPISMIAGTSIGALVGGCYLAGTLDELEGFARSLTRSNMLRYMDFTLRATGLISGERLCERMNEHMSETLIEDLPKPFVAVATDLNNGHEIWLHDGPLVPAVRASYALPGVFLPVEHNGRLLVDGAVVNPVPVSACRMHEPDIVIAVNLNSEVYGRGTVIRTSHYDSIQNEIAAEETAQSSWWPFMAGKNKQSAKQNQMGVTGVMVEAYNIIQDRISRTRLAGDPPDYTVRPRLKHIGMSEFHKAAEGIEIGYNEMMSRARELENHGAFKGL